MRNSQPNHYATLGLHRRCTDDQIRDAYRILAKQHHPDVNNGCTDAVQRTQALNAAYEILGDPQSRAAYDRELDATERKSSPRNSKKSEALSQDLHLRLDEFIKGTQREVRINDPGNATGPEVYDLVIPPQTAPGTRFRIRRDNGNSLNIRVRPLPHFQFKPRGSDLRCDLKITARRAADGGEEFVGSVTGGRVRIRIPRGVERGEIIRLEGEGLPNTRGGRGDLLVRILYRPEIRIVRPRR